ncbi:acyltransferase [Actinobacteria bacterium YIM 96077]|uniref:Acyltransferase n=1 Tax=Phytoactinopolyspora halophila TaxID=1981511 RepID=A0A329R2D0_9ACTN|nr:acyltransferase [Phytoactinopolyspora halophila]AYY13118.1 acyltransferase [Actinobacteria bacterium YIM 96077]RAW17642.1 acyltransferase [Phytoactinopolyspora halophila]
MSAAPTLSGSAATSGPAWIAASTPDDRDRVIDAVRVTSLLVVVLGHWLMADVSVVDGGVRASNVLDQFPALHIVTWLFQVMPLFFVAGGFANATVWRRICGASRWTGNETAGERHDHRREVRGCYVAYVRARMSRLLTPVLVFALLAQGTLGIARLAGLPETMVGEIAQAWGQPLWFLAIYIVVTALAPVMVQLHARAPAGVLAGLAGAVATADLTRMTTDAGGIAYTNFLLVWLFAQQLGFWYADGRLARVPRRTSWAIVVAVAACLAALTSLGPYPVSMVGVAGEMSNMNPPSFCLALLAAGQTALVMLIRPRLERWLQRPRVWGGVVSAGAMAMTVYLWHLVALVAVLGAAYVLEVGLPEGGTMGWWMTRPLWLAILLVVLVLLAVPVSRLERLHTSRRERGRGGDGPAPAAVAVLSGLVLATAGLAGYATSGLEPFGSTDGWLLGLDRGSLPSSVCLLVGWLLSCHRGSHDRRSHHI